MVKEKREGLENDEEGARGKTSNRPFLFLIFNLWDVRSDPRPLFAGDCAAHPKVETAKKLDGKKIKLWETLRQSD